MTLFTKFTHTVAIIIITTIAPSSHSYNSKGAL